MQTHKSYLKRVKREKKDKIDRFIILELLLTVAIILSILLEQESLSSMLFTLSFPLVGIHTIVTFYRDGLSYFGALAVGIVLLSIVCTSISSINGMLAPTLSSFNSALIFFFTIFYIYIGTSFKINYRTSRFILITQLVISYIYPVSYLFLSDARLNNGSLTLNFTNPNLTALWLTLTVLYCVLGLIDLPKFWKVIPGISLVLNVLLVFDTDSRNALLALFLFACLCMLVLFKHKLVFSQQFLLTINILPIAVVPIYLRVVQPIIEAGWLDFLIDEGKPLSSRVLIWERCFYLLEGWWLTGRYGNGLMRGNMHNSHMVVLCSFGIIVLILTIVYLYLSTRIINQNIRGKFQTMALSCFFAVLFMGIAEGALFSGGMGIYITACGFLLLANRLPGPGEETDPAGKEEKKKLKSRYIK